MENVQPKDIKKAIHTTVNIHQYADEGSVFHKRYTFERIDNDYEECKKPQNLSQKQRSDWDRVHDIADKVKSGEYRIVEKNGIKYAAAR